MTRKGKHFVNFSPAISATAAQVIRTEVRSWKLPQCSDKAIEDLSRMFNPIVRGWLQYHGRYYRSALYSPMRQLDRDLTLWAAQKYKKLRRHLRRAHTGLRAPEGALRDCSLTGRWVGNMAPRWEPYESRGSRTVLREPRRATPRGYSPGS
jgi:RNA-directed DNA polymerase